ncbi:hypothetical protein GCM10008164_33050 [Achromobacter xylosoxidans]|nr:hypothetical protein GCM10008164_33050 [Achromobacter xylosoxidans]
MAAQGLRKDAWCCLRDNNRILRGPACKVGGSSAERAWRAALLARIGAHWCASHNSVLPAACLPGMKPRPYHGLTCFPDAAPNPTGARP